MNDRRRANEAGYGYGREAEMQARYGAPVGGYASATTDGGSVMTEEERELLLLVASKMVEAQRHCVL